MKGFALIVGLIGMLFPLQILFAKRAAKKDPIDPESLRKVSFLNASGAGGYPGEQTSPKTKKD